MSMNNLITMNENDIRLWADSLRKVMEHQKIREARRKQIKEEKTKDRQGRLFTDD